MKTVHLNKNFIICEQMYEYEVTDNS